MLSFVSFSIPILERTHCARWHEGKKVPKRPAKLQHIWTALSQKRASWSRSLCRETAGARSRERGGTERKFLVPKQFVLRKRSQRNTKKFALLEIPFDRDSLARRHPRLSGHKEDKFSARGEKPRPRCNNMMSQQRNIAMQREWITPRPRMSLSSRYVFILVHWIWVTSMLCCQFAAPLSAHHTVFRVRAVKMCTRRASERAL